LKRLLESGSSIHWKKALAKLTGSESLSAAPLLEYFKPLYDHLVEENKKTDEFIGWVDDGADLCVS
jgi:peptidyl-dipeptidase A